MAMEQDGAGARESVLQGKWVFRTLPILFFYGISPSPFLLQNVCAINTLSLYS